MKKKHYTLSWDVLKAVEVVEYGNEWECVSAKVVINCLI